MFEEKMARQELGTKMRGSNKRIKKSAREASQFLIFAKFYEKVKIQKYDINT